MSCTAHKIGEKTGQGSTAWEQAGHWSVGAEQLVSFASLVFLGFNISLSLSLTISFQSLNFSQPPSCLTFSPSLLSPTPPGCGVNKQLSGA